MGDATDGGNDQTALVQPQGLTDYKAAKPVVVCWARACMRYEHPLVRIWKYDHTDAWDRQYATRYGQVALMVTVFLSQIATTALLCFIRKEAIAEESPSHQHAPSDLCDEIPFLCGNDSDKWAWMVFDTIIGWYVAQVSGVALCEKLWQSVNKDEEAFRDEMKKKPFSRCTPKYFETKSWINKRAWYAWVAGVIVLGAILGVCISSMDDMGIARGAAQAVLHIVLINTILAFLMGPIVYGIMCIVCCKCEGRKKTLFHSVWMRIEKGGGEGEADEATIQLPAPTV